MQKVAIILSGPPLSGKSTWAKKYRHSSANKTPTIISRDVVRMKAFNLTNYNDYKFTGFNEAKVSRQYWNLVDDAIARHWDIVFDNTFCRDGYIIEHCATMFEAGYDVKIVWFDVPLWKLYFRNYVRWFKTKKWIPLKVIRDMKTGHEKINRKKYEHMVYQ